MFSFFKNKSNPTPPGPQITSADNEHHGLNWSTLLSDANQESILQTLCTDPQEKDVEILAESKSPQEYLILVTNQNTRSILRNEYLITAFPYLKTDRRETFQVRAIQEWSYTNHLEAVISVSYQDELGIKFFATDYSFNAEKYQTSEPLQINITGLGYFIEDINLDEVQKQLTAAISPKVPMATGFSENFCCLIPQKESATYSFIGKIKQFHEYLLGKTSGYLITLNVTPDYELTFFIADFNLRTEPAVNKAVYGVVWLTGTLE